MTPKQKRITGWTIVVAVFVGFFLALTIIVRWEVVLGAVIITACIYIPLYYGISLIEEGENEQEKLAKIEQDSLTNGLRYSIL